VSIIVVRGIHDDNSISTRMHMMLFTQTLFVNCHFDRRINPRHMRVIPPPPHEMNRGTLIVQSFGFRFWFVFTHAFPNIMSRYRSLGIVTTTFWLFLFLGKKKKSITSDVTQ